MTRRDSSAPAVDIGEDTFELEQTYPTRSPFVFAPEAPGFSRIHERKNGRIDLEPTVRRTEAPEMHCASCDCGGCP